MGKVSIGMLGWRFDEDEVFEGDGSFRQLDEMPHDVRQRLVRLGMVTNAPCNACWLIHGDENVDECNRAGYIYGEPLSEVIVCEEHEPDFIYWFREDGGSEYRGSDEFQDAFFEWFLDGNRAPDRYEGMEYVESDPDDLPDPPRPDAEDFPELMGEAYEESGMHEEPIEASDLDLSAEYPRKE